MAHFVRLTSSRRGRRTCTASPTAASRRRCGPGASGTARRARRPARRPATASSMAASIVQRPSPESCTLPVIAVERRVLGERARAQIEQPRGDDAAAPPHLGDVGEVEVEAVSFRQRLRIRVAEDVEAFGVRLHQAVLDAVVDHLDEVARRRPDRSAGSPVRPTRSALAARRWRDAAQSRRQRPEDRLEVPHRLAAAPPIIRQ